MQQRRRWRFGSLGLAVAVLLVAASCSDDDGEGGEDVPPETPAATDATEVSGVSDDAGADAAADTSTPVESAASTSVAPGASEPAATPVEDRAFYVLPPGNYGGLPTNENSLDQLPLYDGLTPLRGEVTDADIEDLFLPQDFEPIGETVEEPTGRPGTTILYDEFGVPHITGATREDLAFGAGWVSARDRGPLLEFGRGPARAAIADIPGIDAFSLVTGGQEFVPSAAVEQMVSDQVQLLIDTYGEEGEQIIADAQAYADGLTAYWEANGSAQPPATVNDVIATTAFIGSIFGAGGGGEARNAEFLSALQERLGDDVGRRVWEDLLPTDDPEAPTTLEERFEYPGLTGGEVVGSAVIDDGSIITLDPRAPAEGAAPVVEGVGLVVDSTDPEPVSASNWLMVEPDASARGTALAVMGPQLGYYYPEIVQQIHLSGPGIEAQGAAVPGLAMYILIGRTEDYAWSLTSANQDVRDVYVETLCEPDGSPPTRESGHYEFDGECVAFESFDAGVLAGEPIRYPVSVHGPVIGTATSDGSPVALTRKRSTFGRDSLNLGALKDMTEGDADTAEDFHAAANKFGFTFNWGYANREETAYFASGLLPIRSPGLDRRLPTWGNGDYEWQGFLEQDEHPHAVGHPTGLLLNWNNQSAPGFMHGDNNQYGSAHRVERFDGWPEEIDLAAVVGVMNHAATEDVRSDVWPVISAVLAEGAPTSDLAAEAVSIVDEWIDAGAPLLDADEDGDWDDAGAAIMWELFDPLVLTVAEPVLGPLFADDIDIRGIDDASFVDKDLRALLGEPVEGPFDVSYCGAGDLAACHGSLWATVEEVTAQIASAQGDDPTTWRIEGLRSTFAPGLIDDDFRSTNRPTYQQVLEFAPAS